LRIPIQISFRHLDPSAVVEAKVRERAENLEKYFPRILSCRVMIEAPQRRRHKGKLYHVRVELGVPGRKLVVARYPKEKHAHEDIHVAVRDAFDAARRRLEDYVRRVDVRVKAHATPAHGVVVRLFPEDDYGFIATPDGDELYFHRNSVVGAFERLKVGSRVRFAVAAQEGIKGPQASSVHPLGKHHILG
jgi:cold shock CspA family protein/ribosome-associated translation inhibitor RaiA